MSTVNISNANLAETTVKSPLTDDAKYKTQTHRTAVTVEQTWTLEHFSCYVDSEEKLYSAPFTLGYGYPSFSLALRPFGRDELNKDYVLLYLICNGKTPVELSLNCQFSIIGKDGQHRRSKEYRHTVVDKACRRSRFIARSKLLDPKNGLLLDDQLKIYCKITATFNQSTSGLAFKCSYTNLQNLSLKLNKLLDTGHHSDVILAVDGIEMPAHKAILSASSSVFERMFEYSDTKEAQEGKVIIEDVDVDTFKVLLNYLYTEQIPEPSKLTEELLIVSDKYLISDLKLACEEHLSSMLTIDSVARLYLFADTHNAATLKTNCLHYILANTVKVMASEGWKAMHQARPELVDTILRQFALRFAEFKSRG